jgi:anti-anti-sigma factor
MTTSQQPAFTVAVHAGPDGPRLRVTGELDYDTYDELLRYAERYLAAHPDLRDLRIDCADLRFCDSMGLSCLLTVHRRTTEYGMRLHLDNAPPFLERLLATTRTRRSSRPANVPSPSGTRRRRPRPRPPRRSPTIRHADAARGARPRAHHSRFGRLTPGAVGVGSGPPCYPRS